MTYYSMSFFLLQYIATTEIYTLSLHDALPILLDELVADPNAALDPAIRAAAAALTYDLDTDQGVMMMATPTLVWTDRKSTRLNSSHPSISYAVFCLKKKTGDVAPHPHISRAPH